MKEKDRPEGARRSGSLGITWEGPQGGTIRVSRARSLPFFAVEGRGADWIWLSGRTYRIPHARGTGGDHDAASGAALPGGNGVEGRASLDGAPGGSPAAPIPGIVVRVAVAAGDEVEEGALLAVISAMKMEHEIRAERPGTIAEVRVSEGDRVEAGDLLVRIEPR